MRALFVPLSACLLLSGCAVPLVQAAATQMMSGPQMAPNAQMTPSPACVAGTACTGGMGSDFAKSIGTSIQRLTGLASADQPAGK
jgi:uncharacterized protein YceK